MNPFIKIYQQKTLSHRFILAFMFLLLLLLLSACSRNENEDTNLSTETSQTLESSISSSEIKNTTIIEPKIFEVNNLEETRMNGTEISDYYITNIGSSSNLYYIDEDNILWGAGYNTFGQLGTGSTDDEFHEEMVKIAENVIHIDCSRSGFLIYLTEDNSLYGLGDGSSGIFYQDFNYMEGETLGNTPYVAVTPTLLMENIKYARCGSSNIIVIATDDSVWTWGIDYYYTQSATYTKRPIKLLENAKLITGTYPNYAVLLHDGSLWTWGDNHHGNCGIANNAAVKMPQKVAEDVSMVWTGKLFYNVDCIDINEFYMLDKNNTATMIEEYGEFDDRGWSNTFIQKSDGSLWVCGYDVGDTEHVIKLDALEYSAIYSSEFLPCEIIEK